MWINRPDYTYTTYIFFLIVRIIKKYVQDYYVMLCMVIAHRYNKIYNRRRDVHLAMYICKYNTVFGVPYRF